MESRLHFPWNWLKKERDQQTTHPPSKQREGSLSHYSDHPLLRMHNEMDKLFDTFFSPTNNTFPTLTAQLEGTSFMKPQLDISENNEQYTIQMDAPGIEEKDLTLELNGDILTISGERRQESEDEGENYHQIERSYGKFQRLLTLPENADTQHIAANFNKGVLTIELPKSPEKESRRQTIKIAENR